MQQTRKSLCLIIVAAALLAGCGSMKVGRDFDYATFASKVKPGTTDISQVSQWLGPPIGKGMEVNADGTRLDLWTWYYGQGKMGSDPAREFKMLQVKFDQQGKLVSYVWSGDLAGGAQVEDKSQKK
jgi:outer membrane protein assembly factor BamE (lipoprotein component of BamABCDE complex)